MGKLLSIFASARNHFNSNPFLVRPFFINLSDNILVLIMQGE